MSKEPSVVVEQLRFVGRESPKHADYHRDTYQVTQRDSRTGKVIGVVQRQYTVFKRFNKTANDKRSGAHTKRFANRRNDPQRSSRAS